jgi:hypothetical protein
VTAAKWLGAVLVLVLAAAQAPACRLGAYHKLDQTNARLHGQVLDYTSNHGADRRIWSPALQQKRDLYVYLPPGFDPHLCYPVMLWFHGIAEDETAFLDPVVEIYDAAISCGQLPPLIIVAPDGSIRGRPSYLQAGSFYINSHAGNFEDYIIQDVWGFAKDNFPIRPEPEAHILAGASMGGFGAYNLGIKYRECFHIVFGIFPPLNMRWVDCHCRYRADFDPCCWAWRNKMRPNEVVARLYCGIVPIRLKHLMGPLFGRRDPEAIPAISRENPIEMIDSYHLRPGELSMYIAYAGKDEFNIDAQVESFLYVARERGLCIEVGYDPNGRHDKATAVRLSPGIITWLAPQLAPYSPPVVQPCPVDSPR